MGLKERVQLIKTIKILVILYQYVIINRIRIEINYSGLDY